MFGNGLGLTLVEGHLMNAFGKMAWAALILGAGLVSASNCLAEEKAVSLKAGDPAPKFVSTDDQDKEWKSADHVGKKILVLYFYPADLTGGCTKQACGFRDDMKKLADQGVEVVGVSGDAV